MIWSPQLNTLGNWRIRHHKINKATPTILCPVVKHNGSVLKKKRRSTLLNLSVWISSSTQCHAICTWGWGFVGRLLKIAILILSCFLIVGSIHNTPDHTWCFFVFYLSLRTARSQDFVCLYLLIIKSSGRKVSSC